jgi:hypothetical protein
MGNVDTQDRTLILRELAAIRSDYEAARVKSEVYGRTCQYVGEVFGWSRDQQREGEALWDAMARVAKSVLGAAIARAEKAEAELVHYGCRS